MKFRVTMKTPDALDHGINEAVGEQYGYEINGASDDAIPAIASSQMAHEIAEKWFQHGEQVTVEIDTEAKTCVVVQVK